MSENNIKKLVSTVLDKKNFVKIQNYIDFSLHFLEYIEKNKQATIVSQNENIYRFFQYPEDVNFTVTRPFNSKILLSFNELNNIYKEFISIIKKVDELKETSDIKNRELINKTIYTLQQCIGFALDASSINGETNTARKINGDLFERLILIFLQDIGINCRSGSVKVPININEKEKFEISYQQDLVIEKNDEIKIIGSVKTTSKDRIDKVFIDKFLYSKLTDTTIPHIAVFLHDVQRKKTKKENVFGINTTFLCNRFKGYTIKLNPLDGVYYFDPRPIMGTDNLLKQQIKTFDHLIFDDIWRYL